MSKIAIFALSLLLIIFVVAMWFTGNYNSLVSGKKQVEKAWGSVETAYQFRYDIIDNLTETLKGAQKQESGIYTAIANSRKMFNEATTVQGKAEASAQIETNMLALLPRLQEAQYPNLQTMELVKQYTSDLKGTEITIKDARDNYNNIATNWNTNVLQFPKAIFASIFGFKEVELFKSTSGAEKAIKVKF